MTFKRVGIRCQPFLFSTIVVSSAPDLFDVSLDIVQLPSVRREKPFIRYGLILSEAPNTLHPLGKLSERKGRKVTGLRGTMVAGLRHGFSFVCMNCLFTTCNAAVCGSCLGNKPYSERELNGAVLASSVQITKY